MTSLSSSLKKGENFFAFRQSGRPTVGLEISCIVRVELIALREIVIKLWR